jgi:hypothetical protein
MLRFVALCVAYSTAAVGRKGCRMTDTTAIFEEDRPRPRIETLPLAEPRPRSTNLLSPAQPHMGDELRQLSTDEGRRHSMLTRAVLELGTTRIEPDYSGRRRMRRDGNGVDMLSLADEISRETEASLRASRSADYDDALQEIRRRLRKLTYGDMIAMAEQIIGVEGYKPAVNMEEMAAMLYRWSTTEQSDEPQAPAGRSR